MHYCAHVFSGQWARNALGQIQVVYAVPYLQISARKWNKLIKKEGMFDVTNWLVTRQFERILSQRDCHGHSQGSL